jgi:hypothetical protein
MGMQLSCPERPKYISNPKSAKELERLRESTLQEIEYCFGSAQVKGIQDTRTLRRKTDNQALITIPENVNVCVLEKEIADQVFAPKERGRYFPLGNKIILNPGKWCRKTLIHECLHSVSIFSHPNNSTFFEKTKLFAEGATEFLTGILLFGNHIECYENWIHKKYNKVCGLSYPHETRTFFAFCGFVDPQVLVDLYFGTRSDIFPTAWTYFIDDIRRQTGCNFKDVLDEGMKIGLITAFGFECEHQFKRKFRDLKRTQLDYNRLRN